jgi:hypothetical protein
MENNAGYVLGWDDEIQKDSQFVTLPEGDYDFEVIEFERARHPGSEKLPACPKAIVHIKIEGKEGTSIIKHNLFLHSATEGMLCAFFTGIGQRKHGEKLRMNWNAIVGAKGRAKVGIRKFTNDKGQEMEFNEIKKFYDFGGEPKGFQPGRF